jgi:hypothetical protein
MNKRMAGEGTVKEGMVKEGVIAGRAPWGIEAMLPQPNLSQKPSVASLSEPPEPPLH